MTTQDSLSTFDFLAHPHPPRAQTSAPRPTPDAQTISRHRSNTVTAISTWVAGILPGSPPPASPPPSSTFSRRPSLFGVPRLARQHSRSLIPFADTPDPSLRTSEYAYTIVPLPIPTRLSASSPRSSPRTKREYVSGPDDMKFSPLLAMRLRKSSTQVVSDSHSPTLPKKKGFMRFLHLQRRSRAVHPRKALQNPPSSPTTLAFRIAHQKRALYVQCGALPLPLESEVAVMQFMDGGSRADATARLGATYKDESGVVYTDEAEARECLPLLLPVQNDGDDADLFGLPSALSGISEGFIVPSLPPSPLIQTSPPLPAPVQHPPTPKLAADSFPLALLSIPARGGGTSVPGYLHTAPPSLPVPFGGLNSKAQLTPPVETNTSRGKRRRRPAPLTLHLPAHGTGFEDSFAPCVVVEAPSPTAR
ncbi:hypothetical protein BGY98DRAFT_617853 [Russula aff. rugulosa BPL654]|nr:hypothetical protein BGY98DRAFT_617853 [Russula aff. rugulosa BPL654]